jgi:hypothetical protein
MKEAIMDFQEQLAKRLRSLERLCFGYEEGDIEQGVELAGPLAVIFHDTPQSTSLLRHLGKKDIKIASTCRKYRKDWLYWPIPNLVGFQICPERSVFRPAPAYQSNGMSRFLPFIQWWDEIIFKYKGLGKISRKNLVYNARNKDGIGHVDASLPANYDQLIGGLALSMENRPDGQAPKTIRLRDAHAASLRQIAYEALSSPELLALAPTFSQREPPPTPQGEKSRASFVKFGEQY